MPPPRRRTTLRVAFAAYATVLFTATHWPSLRIPTDVPRADLQGHLAAFGLFNALLIAAAFFGPALARRNVLLSTAAALVYAAVDEALQAIPFLNRHAAIDDYAANACGILVVCAVALLVARLRPGPRTPASFSTP